LVKIFGGLHDAQSAVAAELAMRALLLLCRCIALGRPSRALSEQPQQVAYIVESRVDAQPILAYTGYAASQTSDWQQVFNPTWVQPSPATGNRSGLLVRSQNCKLAGDLVLTEANERIRARIATARVGAATN
jgi:hypothetical protein